jgi:hypothetical protein
MLSDQEETGPFPEELPLHPQGRVGVTERVPGYS